MKADNFIFEREIAFGKQMIDRISKEMGIVPDCVDKIIITIRYIPSSSAQKTDVKK